jgi:hypothetical protein
MSKVLVIFKDNWADEMDIEGFDILTKDQWEYKKLELEHTQFPQDVGLGTNESNDYESAEQFLAMFKVIPISDEEEKIIKKCFGEYSFGTIPFIEGSATEDFYEKYGFCPK